MIRRPPRSTLFPTRRSSDLNGSTILIHHLNQKVTFCPRRRISGRLQADEHSRHLERNAVGCPQAWNVQADRKSTRLNSSHANISYAVFCLKKKHTTSGHLSF